MKNNIKEIFIAVALVSLLLLVLNPFDFWMPNMAHMIVLACLIGVFGIYAGYVLREKIHDEREGVHRMFAGRVAFLVGTFVLIVATLIGAWKDQIDPWVVTALTAMIVAKIFAHAYSDKNL